MRDDVGCMCTLLRRGWGGGAVLYSLATGSLLACLLAPLVARGGRKQGSQERKGKESNQHDRKIPKFHMTSKMLSQGLSC